MLPQISVAPSRGSFVLLFAGSWGSRPRLNIFRRSAAQFFPSVGAGYIPPLFVQCTDASVVRASRPHDFTLVDEVRPGRPHHKRARRIPPVAEYQ